MVTKVKGSTAGNLVQADAVTGDVTLIGNLRIPAAKGVAFGNEAFIANALTFEEDGSAFIYVGANAVMQLDAEEGNDVKLLGYLKVQGQNAGIYAGAGSPNGVLTANPGSLYLNISGGATAGIYVKESGIGNTGWVGK